MASTSFDRPARLRDRRAGRPCRRRHRLGRRGWMDRLRHGRGDSGGPSAPHRGDRHPAFARGNVGLDIVAALSLSAALAFGEPLAGNVGGADVCPPRRPAARVLRRGPHARRGDDGPARPPRRARARRCEVGTAGIGSPDRADLAVGDRIPRPARARSCRSTAHCSQPRGDLRPVGAPAGESLPAGKRTGDEVLSGVTDAGEAVEIEALRPAAESTMPRSSASWRARRRAGRRRCASPTATRSGSCC